MDYYSASNQFLEFLMGEWMLLLIFSLIFYLYFEYTKTFDYFEKRGINYIKPTTFFGNILGTVIGKKSFIKSQLDIYKYFKGQHFGGVFVGRIPVLYILDPDLLKAITIRDFDHFCDRCFLENKEPKYISRCILYLKGAEWKAVRSLVTPAFSSARLKNMFPLIQQCTDRLVHILDKHNNSDVEINDMMVNLTLEITGVTAFGISTDRSNGENTEFKKTAMDFNKTSVVKRLFMIAILFFAPKLMRHINISMYNNDANEKLVNILRKTRSERISTGTRRNDFVQLLIDASTTEKKDIAGTQSQKHLDEVTVNAQSLVFLLAGFETTSTLLSFAIYHLAIQPEIQDKLRDHIEEIMKGEELCYDHIAKFDYLDAFLAETLRMYPPVYTTSRRCTKPYTLPGTSIKLEVGDVVKIPIYEIHMDPEIYPEPEKFQPERFMCHGKNDVPSNNMFLAFGAGPRNCIGGRFAMVIAKATIVTLVRNFKLKKCSKTEVPIAFIMQSFFLTAKSGVWVQAEKIN